MASLLASLLIKLGIDHAELKSGLSVAERDLQKATRRIEKIGAGMVDTGKKLSMAVTLPMLAIGGLAVSGALEQRAAIAQVEAALASMGSVSGKTAAELAKTADALEMHSLVDADVILTKVTANLLTFGNVAGEVFDRAQQAALDMAQRMGSDPQAAAIMLGKALNDPIKGITALTRVGVQFTEAQKAQIKAFQDTGQTAKAQGIILAEVERQFRGAAQAAADTSPWRQATVAINQAGDAFGEAILPIIPVVTDLVVRVAQAFANLSPTMQTVVLVSAAVATAFGPILVGVGMLVTALASRLGPALIAFRANLAATAAAEITAAGASTALTVALRGLLIATGVGAVITVLAGAVYLYSTRTREAVPATQAYSQALSTAQQTGKDAQVAADRLAQAMGRERKAALEAAQAQRILAAERLRAAQADLLQAEYRAKTTAIEAKRTASLASGGGPGEGVQGRISPSQQRFNAARKDAGQAAADAKAAEGAVIELQKAVGTLDRQIASATSPAKIPAFNVGAIDAGTAAIHRGTGAVGGLGDAAGATKEKTDGLRDALDAIFPEERAYREAVQQQQYLAKQLEAGRIAADRYSDAVLRLWENYLGLDRVDLNAPIEAVDGAKSVEELNKEIVDRSEEAMGKVSKNAEVTKVRVVESFTQMIEGALSQIDRFVRGIKSGNWLDIIQGLLNAIDGIAAAFTNGEGTKVGPFTFGDRSGSTIPRHANGTNFHPGGLAIVGERGRELVNLPRGSQVHSNRELTAMGGGGRAYFDLRGAVVTEDLLRQMNGMVASGIADAAPGIAGMGARQALGAIRSYQDRSMG